MTDEWERKQGLGPSHPGDFTFPPILKEQHALIMAYLYLRDSQRMLSQCEFYFRQYPFSGTPISRSDHARNMCEYYCSCFYIIQERFTETLNKLKAVCLETKIDIGKSIKSFEKMFKHELRARIRYIIMRRLMMLKLIVFLCRPWWQRKASIAEFGIGNICLPTDAFPENGVASRENGALLWKRPSRTSRL